jgi:hypothetical protein
MKIIGGLIAIAIGTLIVIKSEDLLKNFGRISFFEKHLGAEGGSRLGYKIIGLIVIFIGLMATTGLFDGFMQALVSPLVRGSL